MHHSVTRAANSNEVSQGRDVHAGGPVGDGVFPEHSFLRQAVELETPLQTIASVQEGVRVTGAESDQTGRKQLIHTLHQREEIHRLLLRILSGHKLSF